MESHLNIWHLQINLIQHISYSYIPCTVSECLQWQSFATSFPASCNLFHRKATTKKLKCAPHRPPEALHESRNHRHSYPSHIRRHWSRLVVQHEQNLHGKYENMVMLCENMHSSGTKKSGISTANRRSVHWQWTLVEHFAVLQHKIVIIDLLSDRLNSASPTAILQRVRWVEHVILFHQTSYSGA